MDEEPTDTPRLRKNQAPDAEQIEHSRAVLSSSQIEFPTLWPRIVRQLLLALHRNGAVDVGTIYEDARQEVLRLKQEGVPEPPNLTSTDAGGASHLPESNVGVGHVWGEAERQAIERLTLKFTETHLTPQEISGVVLLARKHAEADTLEDIANLPGITFDLLVEKIDQYCTLAGKRGLPAEDAMGARVALIRRLVSESIEFLGVAKKHLSVRDLRPIVKSTVGNRTVLGRIGGKAGGMMLAATILRHSRDRGESTFCDFAIPESFFVRTDVFMDFMSMNGLMGEYDQKYKPVELVRAEYPGLREVFTNSEMPEYVIGPLRTALKNLGEVPLIVRSSSLLEDNFGSAFSGKYASIFLGNQGPLETRLRMLLGAIAEVYASTFGPDPVAYRKERNLLDYDEQMAVMVQKVVGRRCGDYYFPLFAGVAFARNEYRWSRRIKKEDGMARLVCGLGTRAVDRVGNDYARLVPLGMPTLRAEGSVRAMMKYSQHYFDVINLKRNRFETLPKIELFTHGSIPDLDRVISIHNEGALAPPVSTIVRESPKDMVVTFDKLISSGFAESLRTMLRCLEEGYGCPVEMEFAHDGNLLHILQCRPLAQRIEANRVMVPKDIPRECQIFSAERDVRGGRLIDVEYIVHVDPRDYAKLESTEKRLRVARVIGRLNIALEEKSFIIMGPGRFGTRDLRLGISTTYADISNTKMLVEIARSRDGYVPEVSYGTHFFQDLVEAGIYNLPLYPESSGIVFNDEFLSGSATCLTDVIRDAEDMVDTIRVIHVPSVAGGKNLQIDMDGEEDKALAYLARSSMSS